ncbi:T9SS type A sorting domain-containing protein [Aureivirga sp. CE67]|uniref:T9SS type A sorting domain-containing protein n=1 Tax=Aureivirga sp. CE67 TaxID=1788983 RepID=UPI0018CB3B81|nr:T9SS type A sorting domain-containing protein [Aureivirga sp. CE67]
MRKLKNLWLLIFLLSFTQNYAQTTDVITGLDNPYCITLKGNDLYFRSNLYISKVDLSNTSNIIQVANSSTSVYDMIFDENILYSAANNRIGKKDINDGNTNGNSFLITGFGYAHGITKKDGVLYVADWQDNLIYKTNIENPSLQEVISVTDPLDLTFNGDDLYISTVENKIYKTTITDVNPTLTEITSTNGRPYSLLIFGNDLFYTEFETGKILKIDITESSPVATEVVSNLSGPIDMAFDGIDLYIAEKDGDKISKLNINQDSTAPEITSCPSSLDNISVNENCQGVIPDYTNLVIATDDFTNPPSITQDPTPGSILEKGITTIIFTASDSSGNTTTCSTTVTVIDNQGPIPNLETLPEITAECEVTNLSEPSATDSCGGNVIVSHNATLPITTQGTTVVTWTFEDENGNTSTQIQNISINDNIDPFTFDENLFYTTGYGTPELILDETPSIMHMMIVEDTMYFVNWSSKKLQSFSLSDPAGTLQELYTSPSELFGLTEKNGELYLSNTGGEIIKYTINTQQTEIIASDLGSLRGLAFNGEDLYCGIYNLNKVIKLNPSISNPIATDVVTGIGSPMGIDFNGNDLFIADYWTSKIYKVDVSQTLPINNPGAFNSLTRVVDVKVVGEELFLSRYSGGGIFKTSISGSSPILIDNTYGQTASLEFKDNTIYASAVNFGIYKIPFETEYIQNELADITANCEVTSLETPSTSDNCSENIIVTHDATLPITEIGATTVVTWTIDDGNGNIVTVPQNIIIVDNEKPEVIVLEDLTADCEINEANIIAPITTDNCAGEITATTESNLNFSEQGTFEIVWKFNDGNDNEIEVIQNVIINDITDPETIVLEDLTTECEINEANIIAPTTTDNCVGEITATTESDLNFTEQGSFEILWIFNDGNDNEIEVIQNVIINDITDPEIIVLEDLTAECEINEVNIIAPTTTDNCAGEITATTESNLNFSEQGTFEIVWIFNDGNDNEIEIIQNVIINDITDPETIVLEDLTAECEINEFNIIAPTTTDNCAGEITATTESDLNFTEQGTFEIVWIFNDGNDNEIEVIQNVIIDDITDPEAIVLENLTAECEINEFNIIAPTTTDNCAGEITATTESNLNFSEQGTFEIVWIFNDGNDNEIEIIQNVIINDITDPEAIILEDLTADCEINEANIIAPTTTDNCAGVITATTESDLNFTEQGTFEIIWIFNDGNDNEIEVIQNVIIDDIINPETIVLEDLTAECEINEFNIIAPTTTDNCAGVITATTESDLNFTEQGTFEIIWIFNDGNDNEIEVIQNVIIDDITNPEAVALGDINAQCELSPSEITFPITTDNCAGEITATTNSELTFTEQGTFEIVWKFNDGNDNEIEVIQIVTIEDTEAPTFVNCYEDIIIDMGSGCEYPILDYTEYDFGLADNCSDEITVTQNLEPETIITESTEIIITFTDIYNNTSECSFMLEVIDTVAPYFECPETQNISVEENELYTLEDFTIDIPVSFACDEVSFTQTPAPGTELEPGDHTITLEIEDEYGNTDSCEFLVKVTEDLDIDEVNLNSLIKVFPNPAKDILNIESKQEIESIYILDLTGKIIFKQKDNSKKQIDVSTFARGVYYIKVNTQNNSTLKKILIQ